MAQVEEASRAMKKRKFDDGEKGKNSKKSEDELLLVAIEQEKDTRWNKKDDYFDYGVKCLPPKKLVGTDVDVISLLSNNGKTNYLVKSDGEFFSLDYVNGKTLIICCVSLPLNPGSHSDKCWRAMLQAYSSSSSDVNRFELVVAVTVRRRRKEKRKRVFDRFISQVPCLAIPFPYSRTRKSICSFIGFQKSSPCHSVSAILVSPTGTILGYRNIPRFFYYYGFDWFTSTLNEIDEQDTVLRIRLDPFHKRIGWPDLSEAVKTDALLSQPLSLDKDILLCDDPSRVLSTFCQTRSLTVSQLSKKYVGLYLCLNLEFIHELKIIHDECIANNQELEILLVFLPITYEQRLYYQELLESVDCIQSWFILPYDNKVSRRLWRVFGLGWCTDRFIILPPNSLSGELAGRSVVTYYLRRGIPAYPFTRSSVLEQRYATLKSITAASLFESRSRSETDTCLVQNGTDSTVVLPMSAIIGKKLLVYFDKIDSEFYPSEDGGELFRLLMKHYPEIRAMGCEVVFVPLIPNDRPGLHVQLAKMPWPVMPVKVAEEAWETHNLFIWYDEFNMCYHNQVIAVGEDGGILSIQVKKRLKKYGASDSLFRDKLRNDITKELNLLENADDDRM